MRCRTLLGFALTLAWAAPVGAQVPEWVNDILVAARLPVAANEARQEGAANDEVRAVLEAMSRSRVPAHEATAVLDTARSVRREHGPVDNFGAFVQSQLAEGKRGRDLATAIRAEHARRGKGHAGHPGRGRANPGSGDSAARGRDDGRAGGDSAARGRGATRARGDSAARGKPDSAGRDAPRPSGRADSAGARGNRGEGKGRPTTPDR